MADASAGGCVIALDIGGTSVKSGVVRADGQVLGAVRQTQVDSDGPAAAILAAFCAAVAAEHARAGDAPLLAIAAGVPGPFDYQHGVSLIRHKFAAIYGLDLGAQLRACVPGYAGPVRFRNDAEAVVVGEARYGAGRPFGKLLGLTLGTGLGSSFVAAGEPVTGGASVPLRGEVWSLMFRGAQADDQFSIRGLNAALRRAAPDAPSIRESAARARAGDEVLRAAFVAFGADLGAFIRPLAHAFDAEAVLLLGGLAGAADLYGAHVSEAIGIPALGGELGAAAALLGAAALVLPL